MSVALPVAAATDEFVLPWNKFVTLLAAPADATLAGSGTQVIVTVTVTPTPGVALEIQARSRATGNLSELKIVRETETVRLGPFTVNNGPDVIEVIAQRFEGVGGVKLIDYGGLQGVFDGQPPDPDPVTETAITFHPVSRTVAAGTDVTLTVGAIGENLTYELQLSTDGGTNWGILQAASADNTYVLSNVHPAQPGEQFRWVVSGDNDPGATPVISDVAILTVGAFTPTAVINSPADVTVEAGSTPTFGAEFEGDDLTWEGFWNAELMASGTGPLAQFTRPVVTAAGDGSLVKFEATGADGVTVTAGPATVTVVTPDTELGDVFIQDIEVTE